MHFVPWQLREHAATLQLDGLSAEVAAWRPCQGLVNVVAAGSSVAAARLLGVATGPTVELRNAAPVECYVRGADLVVAYESSRECPVRVDAVWRAIAPAAADRFLAAVDLIVSVRTHLLDAHPDLAVESVLPAGDVFRLRSVDSTAGEPPAVATAAPAIMEPQSGSGCLLFRLPNVGLTYVEMVHPVDFQHDQLSHGPPGSGELRVAHRLFRSSLEKGVILRARVRGAFVERRDDVETGAECYAAFASVEPPLGA